MAAEAYTLHIAPPPAPCTAFLSFLVSILHSPRVHYTRVSPTVVLVQRETVAQLGHVAKTRQKRDPKYL